MIIHRSNLESYLYIALKKIEKEYSDSGVTPIIQVQIQELIDALQRGEDVEFFN